MKTIYPIFSAHIKKNNLIENLDCVVAAFSGGKDSVALLYLLKELQKEIQFRLVAAYFNHRIRKDYRREEKWVKQFCSSLNIECITREADVISFKEKNKLNLENAASILRYTFLKKIADQFKSSKVATGHTKSDLTETFFIKLFRGSGSQGLSSIYSKKGDNIIRPLLIFSSQEIIEFLSRNHIAFYQDYSNRDIHFQRNKIRLNLLPAIKNVEPNIENHIFKTVSIIQSEHDYLQQQSRLFLEKNLILKQILPLKELKKCHIALQRFILREYIRKIKGDLLNINYDHVENMINHSSDYNGIAIPELEIKFHKGFLYPGNINIPPYQYTIPSPGTIAINEIEKKLIMKTADRFQKPKNDFGIIVSSSSLIFPLKLRNPEKKDKYKKINSAFDQNVFEMIRSSGIPVELRNICPILLNSDNRPIWVVGSPIGDSFKVTDKTQKKYLKISFV
jgi:tRNA(Ile)-lysidine synthase